MSITSLTNSKKQPSHQRDDSGELDVFEAARYFSGYNDNFTLIGDPNMREERDVYLRGGRRISLDMPSLKYHHQYYHQHNHPISHHHHHQPPPQPPQQIKDKKYKQPRSPGGKLAHFLNSLFSQTSSKKKKSSKSSTQSLKDEDDNSPSGRRKRRSSISHFRSTSTLVDGKSLYSSSSSGFRTPPPYNLNTPTKSYKEFTHFSDHKDVISTLSKYSINGNANGDAKRNNEKTTKGSNLDKLKNNGFVEKPKNNYNHGYQQDKKKKEIKKLSETIDDGGESDSSSDLFELQIDYGFGFCSSGLPVYETTHMDSIKRSSTAITNGPIKN